MKFFDVTPLQGQNAGLKFGDTDSEIDAFAAKNRNYLQKLKATLNWTIIALQAGVLWATFLYIPVYICLVCLNVINIISLFSLNYFISYFVIMLFFIILNKETPTHP